MLLLLLHLRPYRLHRRRPLCPRRDGWHPPGGAVRQEQRHRRRPDVLPVRAQAGNLLEAAPALAQAARLRGGRERLLSRRPTPFPGLQKDLPGVEMAKK